MKNIKLPANLLSNMGKFAIIGSGIGCVLGAGQAFVQKKKDSFEGKETHGKDGSLEKMKYLSKDYTLCELLRNMLPFKRYDRNAYDTMVFEFENLLSVHDLCAKGGAKPLFFYKIHRSRESIESSLKALHLGISNPTPNLVTLQQFESVLEKVKKKCEQYYNNTCLDINSQMAKVQSGLPII